jgi:hypothetical protein
MTDELMMAIVLMHRVACSERIFLGKLIARFRASQEIHSTDPIVADEEGALVVMRHKVCSIILVWLRDFYNDFRDHGLANMLRSFLGMRDEGNDGASRKMLVADDVQEEDLDWSSLMLVKDVMCRVFHDRLSMLHSPHIYIKEQNRDANSDSNHAKIPPSSDMKTGRVIRGSRPNGQSSTVASVFKDDGLGMPYKPWHILQLDRSEVAQQLTLMESRLFYDISYADLLHVAEILG